MKFKKLAAVGLSVVMLASFAMGCGGGNSKDGGDESTAPSGSGQAAEDSTAGGDELSAYFASKDPYTLKVMAFGDADTATLEKISAALSEITREKLNCDVELTRIGFSSYMTQLNLMLSSGDELDLFIPMASPTDYVNAGQIQPIGELLEKFAPNVYGQLREEDWVNQTFNGEIYGLPVNSEKAMVLGVGMRKDVCNELGIDYENFQSMDDLHDVLVKVKEAYPEMYPIVSNAGDMFSGSIPYIGQDSCGDTYNMAVLEDPFDENGEIVSFFETDLFRETCERMYQWNKEGLIMPDASTNTDSVGTLIGAGKAFAYFQHMKPGWEAEQTASNGGVETVAWRYGVPTYTGGSVAWFVPTASGDPERAVAFFDLMYSDPVVANLVINGIEGENYVVVDKEKGIIGYPEGKDVTNNGYNRHAWAWPNQQIGYFWEGDDLTLWDQYKEFHDSAQIPVSFGFKFDATPVMNQLTACSNVYEKYVPALLCGSLNPDETIPVLNEEMQKAGLGDIVKEKQEQFNEWKASK